MPKTTICLSEYLKTKQTFGVWPLRLATLFCLFVGPSVDQAKAAEEPAIQILTPHGCQIDVDTTTGKITLKNGDKQVELRPLPEGGFRMCFSSLNPAQVAETRAKLRAAWDMIKGRKNSADLRPVFTQFFQAIKEQYGDEQIQSAKSFSPSAT